LNIGYARVGTDRQDLTAQRDDLQALGLAAGRVCVDHERAIDDELTRGSVRLNLGGSARPALSGWPAAVQRPEAPLHLRRGLPQAPTP
jgi:DNA invertase Pin-like site-specific DNA recombinase